MKEKKELKIKFKTAITLIILLIIVIVAMITLIINWRKQDNDTINNTQTDIKISEEMSNDELTTEFLKLENNKENLLYSPTSIKYALNMLNDGANGNTKTQIEKVIGNLQLNKYDNIDNILSLANCVYIKDTYKENTKEEYLKLVNERYNAEINYDSFNNSNNINKWIEEKTFGKIKNMLSDEIVQNPNTEMILINALAIDMEWQENFDVDRIRGEVFYLEDGTTNVVEMLNKETTSDSISYYKDEELTALTMDLKKYDDRQLEFVAIMPNENLSGYVEIFSIKECNNILKKATLASETTNGLEITIPKFSFDYDLNLKQDLIKMGITDAFDETDADFSNMSDKALYVSDALHKAKIDFSEKGVKASAATSIVMQEKLAISDITESEKIKIDKPFLYLIRDKKTGEVWFIGTVYEPNVENAKN